MSNPKQPTSKALQLDIYQNGNKTPYHITIAFITNTPFANISTITQDVINKYRLHFGRSNVYVLKFDTQWGPNSKLTKSFNTSLNIGLEQIRTFILQYLALTYPGCINTTRYPNTTPPGMPPQHVEDRGAIPIGTTWNVTYALS